MNTRLFKGSRDVLKGKTHLLRKKGLGKKPNKTNSLTRLVKDVPWGCGQLGDKTPKSIIATLWWQLTQHFVLRGRQEHHSMRAEDFSFRKQSGLHQKSRLQLPKMFETHSERCPVKLF